MVQITVTLARTLTNWQYTATPIETFLSDTGAFVDSNPYSVTVASGNSGVLDIPASTNQKVSYRFEVFQNVTTDRFFLQDGTEYQGARWQWTSGGSFDNNWYTGQAPKDPSQKLLTRITGTDKRFILDPINALCPLVNTNLKDLFSTSVTSYQLDAGARRVAELMLGDVALKAQLPKGINPRGAFLSTNTYNQNDGVTYNGEFWVYESTTAGSSTPGTGTAWRKYIEKGNPGGTGAQSVGFNAATWNAQTAAFKLESTSRGDSLELFNAVLPPDLSGYAQRAAANTFSDSNTFNGAATFNSTCAVPLRAPGTNNANAASTAFVQAALSGFVPNFFPAPVGWARLSSDLTQSALNTPTVIAYNDRPFTTGNFINNVGDIVIPSGQGGLFLIFWSFAVRVTSSFNGTAGRLLWRAFFNQFSPSSVGLSDLARYSEMSWTGTTDTDQMFTAFRLMNLTSGAGYNTQFSIANDVNSGTIRGDVNRSFVALWKVTSP
jgi:hypothetical protein